MNCPNCGAENEADARFCAECGTPLEGQADTADQFLDDEDDRTILSTRSQLAEEEAKTVSVSQEEVVEAVVEEPSDSVSEAEPDSSTPPSGPPSDDGGDGGGVTSQRNIIIAVVVVLVLLCCCCAALGIGGAMSAGGLEDMLDDIERELSLLPVYLYLV